MISFQEFIVSIMTCLLIVYSPKQKQINILEKILSNIYTIIILYKQVII